MVKHEFNWKIGGPAGYGIKSIGAMFSLAAQRDGMHVFSYDEYPSLIRGGHNTYEVTASPEPVYSVRRPVSLLVALDQMTYDLHRYELAEDAGLLYNQSSVQVPPHQVGEGIRLFPIPLDDLVAKLGGEKVMRNVVALGASFALLKMSFALLETLIRASLGGKADAIVSSNVTLAHAGFQYVEDHFPEPFTYQVKLHQNPGRLFMSGNEAIAWGAIKAGCQFYSGYPMTPSTTILHTVAANANKYGIAFKQTEDEISAINAAIGAGYTGVRSMTATSGGGFALMTEALGMAAMVEVPLVVVEAARPGPSSGMPTWTSQGDLRMVLHASQDDFPRVVMAPGDPRQCFELTQHAFDLAETYQVPVLILTDKMLGESNVSLEPFNLKARELQRGPVLGTAELEKMEEFKRYRIDVENGVSPRSLPGTPQGTHVANSDEHNELGFSEEGAEERVKMMDKRQRKMLAIAKNLPVSPVERYGKKHADITFIGWGSTKGAILEAIKDLERLGISANYCQVIFMLPFPKEIITDVIKHATKVAVVENNQSGQLAGLIREHTGLEPDYKILKYDGRPFFPDEIVHSVKEVL